MEQSNSLDRIFGRLWIATSTKPYGLPIFKAFPAPPEGEKFSAFFAAYKESGWDLEEALKPYKEEELDGMVAFYDPATDEYKFCPTLRFLRLNGIRVNIMPVDD